MVKIKQDLKCTRVVLGMSGGVDSSVSLMLLKKAGYEVIGVSLRYETYKCSKRKENVCCSEESFKVAKDVCDYFGCEHKIIDVSKEFDDEVIKYFTKELKDKRTPSPCVFCNRRVKFKALFDYADAIGADFVATGHYAKVTNELFEGKKQYLLSIASDKAKDQTYSLSFLEKSSLDRLIFPLAELTKDDIYSLAQENEILVQYKCIKQSQDFCFLNSDELDIFIEKEVRPLKGKIVGEFGKILGEHKGLSYYTLGQRKKIGLSGGPYYVVKKILPNTLVVSKKLEDAFSSKAHLTPFNLLVDLKEKKYEVLVKSRSSEMLLKAVLEINDDQLSICYPKAEAVLVPGQVAVFYLGSICLGSGVIN